MRPLLIIAACVILLGLTPVWAQHGGGHASGGGHAFGGGHASGGGHGVMGGHTGFSGNSGGGHQFGGSPSSAGSAAHATPHSSPNRSALNRSLSSRNFNHSRGPHRGPGIRIRTRDFRNNCAWFGCGWGYPYPYLGGGIDPYWWWNSGSSDDQNQQYGSGPSDDVNAQNYDQSTRDPGDQDVYARSAPPPRDEERTEAAPATVLVFRDQHKQEVQNYAIVGQTLWTFAPQHTQKIPLADLDLPATTKANEERGVDFRLPGAHEGQ
jgi:hypothetical protein